MPKLTKEKLKRCHRVEQWWECSLHGIGKHPCFPECKKDKEIDVRIIPESIWRKLVKEKK